MHVVRESGGGGKDNEYYIYIEAYLRVWQISLCKKSNNSVINSFANLRREIRESLSTNCKSPVILF